LRYESNIYSLGGVNVMGINRYVEE